jgi:hypothetical protein
VCGFCSVSTEAMTRVGAANRVWVLLLALRQSCDRIWSACTHLWEVLSCQTKYDWRVACVGVAVGTVIAFGVRTHGNVHCLMQLYVHSPLSTALVRLHRNSWGVRCLGGCGALQRTSLAECLAT